MTKPTLSEGVGACALAHYLAGDVEAPRRGSFPYGPLALLLLARYGRRTPDLRTLTALGEDVRVVGTYRSAKVALDRYNATVGADRPEAEHVLKVSARAAFDYCRASLVEAGDFIDVDYESVADVQRVHDDLILLTGILALCLWHVGDAEAREYVRTCAVALLGGADGYRYVRAYAGMGEDVGELYWRAGSGSLGSLTNALKRGARLLDDAGQGAPASEPEWATEAKAKAARDKEEAEALESGPSLLVLASVSHLPGSAKEGESRLGGSTGATVRAEWAPFAGQRWPLLRVPDMVAARAILVGEFPYAVAVIDAVLRDLAGRPHIYIRPLLLVGNPGCGKTRMARRIAEVLGLGFQVCSLSGVSDSALIGTSRQWSTYRASTPLQLLKRLSMACAVVIADEIDKTATSRHNGSPLDGLLPFLTPDACRIVDPALECPVDLSAVSWIATANSLDGLRKDAPALLDRFRIYTVPDPAPEHLPALLRGVMEELRAERGQDEIWMPDLAPDEAELVAVHYRGGSVRGLRRLCEAVLAGREALATRM